MRFIHICHIFLVNIGFERLEKENPLCTLNGLQFRRQIFARPTAAELRGGQVRRVNLLDPQQTLLPQFDVAHLNIITGSYILVTFQL